MLLQLKRSVVSFEFALLRRSLLFSSRVICSLLNALHATRPLSRPPPPPPPSQTSLPTVYPPPVPPNPRPRITTDKQVKPFDSSVEHCCDPIEAWPSRKGQLLLLILSSQGVTNVLPPLLRIFLVHLCLFVKEILKILSDFTQNIARVCVEKKHGARQETPEKEDMYKGRTGGGTAKRSAGASIVTHKKRGIILYEPSTLVLPVIIFFSFFFSKTPAFVLESACHSFSGSMSAFCAGSTSSLKAPCVAGLKRSSGRPRRGMKKEASHFYGVDHKVIVVTRPVLCGIFKEFSQRCKFLFSRINLRIYHKLYTSKYTLDMDGVLLGERPQVRECELMWRETITT